VSSDPPQVYGFGASSNTPHTVTMYPTRSPRSLSVHESFTRKSCFIGLVISNTTTLNMSIGANATLF
jgi:hypothetical protein